MKKAKRILALLLITTIVIVQSGNSILTHAATSTNPKLASSSAAITSVEESNGCIVTLNPLGGTLKKDTKTVYPGECYGTLPSPVLAGYTFEGWFTEEVDGIYVNETNIVNENADHTLYAHWKPITCLISFHANGGNVSQKSMNVTYGQPYGNMPTPELSNYSFEGWYTQPDGGNLIASSDIVYLTSGITLYAKWAGTSSIVSFDANGGQSVDMTKTVYFGSTYGDLPAPEREGYTFQGWYFAGDADVVTSNTSVELMKNHTLYAQWEQNAFTVTFNANGGIVTDKSKKIRNGSLYGSLPTPTYKGHTFLGWFTSPDENSEQVVPSNIYQLNTDQILYAHWKANEYTVYLEGNGANLPYDNITVTYGKMYTKLPELSMVNYTFDGWFTSVTNNISINNTTEVEITSDQVLYAQWTGNAQTITFDVNGGSMSTMSMEVHYGNTYASLPTPSRTGYIFEGWALDSNGVNIVTDTDTVALTSPQTLYAIWTPKTPIITFNANHGSMIINKECFSTYDMEVPYGTTFSGMPVPTRAGYTFEGWYTALSGGTEMTRDMVSTKTGTDTFYAYWSGNIYTVNFELNGGTSYTTSMNVTFGENYGTLPVPTKTNYSFEGWYTEAVEGSKVSSLTNVETIGTHTLYAHWDAEDYKVTYDTGAANTSHTSHTVSYGETYGTLWEPNIPGYQFLGWYSQASGGTLITENTKVTATIDHTIYALLKAKELNITFDANGGDTPISSKTVVYKDSYGVLPIPSWEGYTFAGWYTTKTGSTEIKEGYIVEEESDDILYAHWVPFTYYVSFDANGGTLSSSGFSVTMGENYGKLPTTTRKGYTFEGWYTEISGGSKILSTDAVEIAGNHTLHAHWKQEVYTLKFSPNGGTVSPASTSITKGTTYSDFPTPTKKGYTFAGWYDHLKSGDLVYYVTTTDIIYAHWTPNNYSIYFDANGGSVTTTSKVVAYGENYGELPTPTRKNYVFKGWYTEPDGGYTRTQESNLNSTEPQILYAHWKGVESELIYDANGDTPISTTKTLYYGETYGVLKSPDRIGYHFDGWFTDPTGGIQITADSIVTTTTNQIVYAHWTVKTPEITYNANGGYIMENGLRVPKIEVLKAYGSAYGPLQEAVRAGYTFLGWYTTASSTIQVFDNTMITNTISDTIYARWRSNEYPVSFDTNGGNELSVMMVSYDESYGTLPTPVRDGYGFIGWYTKQHGGTKITSSTKVNIVEPQTLYARWETGTYKITYDALEGSIFSNGSKFATLSKEVPAGGTYASSYGSLPFASRTGYSFDGWYTAVEGGEKITLQTKFTANADQTLYAHWKPISISLILNENGGNPLKTSLKVQSGSVYGMLPTPIREHYAFLGWFTSENGSTEVNENTTMTSTSAETIYAHWQPDTYEITLNSNGGSVSESSLIVSYETTYGTLPKPIRENYVFEGWYTAPAGGTEISSSSVVNITSDTVFYAHWAKATYSVSFGMESVNSKKVYYGRTYGELPAPSRDGYTFEGWFTKEELGNQLISATDKVTLKESHNLSAHWTPRDITIVFDANGGNVETKTKTATYGETYGVLPTPTLAHYTFTGWYSKTGYEKKETTKFDETETQMLTARWTPDTYTVTFDGNGGEVSVSSKTVTYEKEYNTLPTPTKEGYNFSGWYTAAEGGRLVTASSLVTIGKNHTLYAHWKGDTLVVSFHANGGTVNPTAITVTKNEAFGELPTPVREGYDFLGWYTEIDAGTKITSSDIVSQSGSFVLYASWRIHTTTVTFDANGGEVGVNTKAVSLGAVYGELPVPTKTDYTFAGWYTSTEGTDEITAETIVSNGDAHTLYALWIANDELLDKSMDYDEDGLTTGEEMELGTDYFSYDTDGDELSDGDEIKTHLTDPLLYDTDEDGLSDGDELAINLNPLMKDTNNDGILDGDEKTTQTITESIEEEEKPEVTNIAIEMNATGNINSTTSIRSVYHIDTLASDVVGLYGAPVEIETTSTFDTATITFTYDDAYLGNTKEEDLAIMWYNEEENFYEIKDMDNILNTEKNTISYITDKLGTYLLVDSQQWYDVWANNQINYREASLEEGEVIEYYDTVFAFSCSNDTIDSSNVESAKEALEFYIDAMQGDDKACIVTSDGIVGEATEAPVIPVTSGAISVTPTSSSAIAYTSLTDDKDSLLKNLSKVTAMDDTNLETSLLNAISVLENDSSANMKSIILICDEEGTVDESMLQRVLNAGIKVYVVMIGETGEETSTDNAVISNESADDNQMEESNTLSIMSLISDASLELYANLTTLEGLASASSGAYKNSNTKKEVKEVILWYQDKTLTNISIKDSDSDLLLDIYENQGMPLPNGKLVYTNSNKKDTDGDELTDNSEMGWVYRFEDQNIVKKASLITKGFNPKLYIYYFDYRSDPTKVDSDGDSYNDNKDPRPLKSDVIKTTLKHAEDYVRVKYAGTENYAEPYYCGGNQSWFYDAKNNNSAFDKLLEDGGCGVIAATDIILYFQQYHKGYENFTLIKPLTSEDGTSYFSYEAYQSLVYDIAKNYLTPIPLFFPPYSLGVNPLQFEALGNYYKIKDHSSVSVNSDIITNSKKKKKELLKKITEQLNKDIPVPIMIGINKVQFYLYNEDNGVLSKDYKYNLHWVVILEINHDEITNKTMLTVASWGEKYQIDFDEFCEGMFSTVATIKE